jgi:hypothetical protein
VKTIGILGIGVIVALIAIMLFCSGAASASVLCRAEANKEKNCPAGKVYPIGTEVKLETKSVEPVFTTSSGNITCKKSTLELKLEIEGNAEKLATGQIKSLSFTECIESKFKVPCAIELFNQPVNGIFESTEASNGLFFFQSGGKGEPGLTISCTFGVIKCAYEVKPTMKFTGGNPSEVVVSEYSLKTVVREGYTTCPVTTSWSKATYRSVKPQQSYLASASAGPAPPAGSVLCKKAAVQGFCSNSTSASKVYPVSEIFKGSSSSVVLSVGGKETVTCKESIFTVGGKSQGGTSEHATFLVFTPTFGSCLTSAGKSCTLSGVHLSYLGELLYTTASNGEFLVSDGGGGAPAFGIGECPGVKLEGCTYGTGEMMLDLAGGNPAVATIAKGTLFKESGGAECVSEITLNPVTYTLTSPAAVYVAKEVGPTSLLCKAAPTEGLCVEGQAYPVEQEIQGEATKPFLVSSEEDVTCKSSKATFKGKTKGAPTAQASGSITALSFEGCELTSGASCTVEAINAPYSTLLAYPGSLAVASGGKGAPGATVSCSGGALACVFSAEPTLTVESGDPAALLVSKLALKLSTKEGFLKCPKEATLSATYKATSPTAIYVASE